MANLTRAKFTAAALTLSLVAFLFVLAAAPSGQTSEIASAPSPTPEPAFDREAAVAALRESIKGREQEPAETVFKNIQNFKGVPASRILGIMQFGYSRSLGVECTHCHTPEDWSSDSKQTKLIARDMHVMANKINGELLKGMTSLGDRQAIVNCTTCHRGQIKPATNLD